MLRRSILRALRIENLKYRPPGDAAPIAFLNRLYCRYEVGNLTNSKTVMNRRVKECRTSK